VADGLTRKDLLVTAGVGGATVATIGGTLTALALTQTSAQGVLVIRSAGRAARSAAHPDDAAWRGVPEIRVPLLPQQLIPPSLDAAGVASLAVRAMHDDTTLAFRLAWDDPSLDDLDGVRKYHDAVAVMLPTAPGAAPAITMGAAGIPVHILQWRATWQRDLDGKTGVDQIYPRVVHDVMPDDVLSPEVAADYWVGRKAGNPLSQTRRTTPIEQVVAEGFGTTTHLPRTDAAGAGVHDGSGWKVAITVPRERPDAGEALAGGREWHVAFAVWLGDRENRGGRKHYADWVPLRIEDA
jgi:Ethylbenzene dehydrogenase